MDEDENVEGNGPISLAQAPKPSLGPARPYVEETAKRESQGQVDNGYGAKTPRLGRYQMTDNALIDAGMKDAKGNWTGKYNVNSESEFLSNHAAQDLALADYTKKNESYLRKINQCNRSDSQ